MCVPAESRAWRAARAGMSEMRRMAVCVAAGERRVRPPDGISELVMVLQTGLIPRVVRRASLDGEDDGGGGSGSGPRLQLHLFIFLASFGICDLSKLR